MLWRTFVVVIVVVFAINKIQFGIIIDQEANRSLSFASSCSAQLKLARHHVIAREINQQLAPTNQFNPNPKTNNNSKHLGWKQAQTSVVVVVASNAAAAATATATATAAFDSSSSPSNYALTIRTTTKKRKKFPTDVLLLGTLLPDISR